MTDWGATNPALSHCEAPEEILDIMDAHELIAEVTATYEGERKNVDISSSTSTSKVSELLRVSALLTPEMPRVTGRQQHRNNPSIIVSGGLFQEDCGHPSP